MHLQNHIKIGNIQLKFILSGCYDTWHFTIKPTEHVGILQPHCCSQLRATHGHHEFCFTRRTLVFVYNVVACCACTGKLCAIKYVKFLIKYYGRLKHKHTDTHTHKHTPVRSEVLPNSKRYYTEYY